MNVKQKIKKNTWYWRFVLNCKTSYSYKSQLSSSNLKEVLIELNRKGIAFTNFTEFFPEMDWNMFYRSVYDQLTKFEKKGLKYSDEQKRYFDFVLGLNPAYEKDSLWNQIASHPQLQSFADAYFKMKGTRMRYYKFGVIGQFPPLPLVHNFGSAIVKILKSSKSLLVWKM